MSVKITVRRCAYVCMCVSHFTDLCSPYKFSVCLYAYTHTYIYTHIYSISAYLWWSKRSFCRPYMIRTSISECLPLHRPFDAPHCLIGASVNSVVACIVTYVRSLRMEFAPTLYLFPLSTCVSLRILNSPSSLWRSICCYYVQREQTNTVVLCNVAKCMRAATSTPLAATALPVAAAAEQ